MNLPIELSFILLIIIIGLLVFYIYKGYKHGLILEVVITLTLLICALIAYGLSGVIKINYLSSKMIDTPNSELNDLINTFLNRCISFAIIFVIAYIILRLCRNKLKFINKITLVGSVNKIGGALLALIKACIYTIIILLIIASPIFTNGNEVINQSGLDPIKNLIIEDVPIAGNALKGFGAIETFRNKDDKSVEDIEQIIEAFK